MFHEVGMRREVVLLSMFEDEHAIFFQQFFLENQIRNLGQLLKGVWGVGKDEIELQMAGFYESENVTANHLTGMLAVAEKFLHTFRNESVMVAVHFHTHHLTASP